jgi:hypothetical protein
LTGIATALLKAVDMPTADAPNRTLLEVAQHPGETFQTWLGNQLGAGAPDLLAMICFAIMAIALIRVALKKMSFGAAEHA